MPALWKRTPPTETRAQLQHPKDKLLDMMLPYSITFLVLWTLFLLAYWALGLPLGLQATYEYVPM